MKIPVYQVDAFAERVFAGNPAAVCPLTEWLSDETMQSVAAENNLSETAFLVREGHGWRIRWFTPTVEVSLCGHATLAAAWVVLNRLDPDTDTVRFRSAGGELTVARGDGRYWLDFPAEPPERVQPFPDALRDVGASDYLVGRYGMAVLENERAVRDFAPDMVMIGALATGTLIVTAPGDTADFVSRFFGPGVGVPEDPVTGSAHCLLAPCWAGKLGRDRLEARQVSTRGGAVTCELAGDRVKLGGAAIPYLEGYILLPEDE